MSTLNLETIKAAAETKGLSQAKLATSLGVSRESVSKWFKGEATPRPAKLLKLALTLGLSRAELFGLPKDPHVPEVAFRMSRAKLAQESHVDRAQQMGRMLEGLVPHLPFDRFEAPPNLKSPSTEYDYLQELTGRLRKEMGVTPSGAINVQTLAGMFEKLQAVIIPVLWGHRKNHENAIHVYLPRSMTTWVYLNLDTRMCDLKFWLAHELGHAYTFSILKGDEGEDFADRFAATLLFPEAIAAPTYNALSHVKPVRTRVSQAKALADRLEISVVAVAKELDQYAKARKLPLLFNEDKSIYQTHEISKPPLASDCFFGKGNVEFKQLIGAAKGIFHSPFFDALQGFLKEHGAISSYVQGVLDCSLPDAKQVCSELA